MTAPSGNTVYHIQFRVTERDDGYRVTEPGTDLEVIDEDVHDAIATYAQLACGSDE